MKRPPACLDPFADHSADRADTFDHECGHQYDRLPCGCVTADDHDTEECDGRPVAELEVAR